MKKRILFLITSLGGGGAEKVLVDLVKNLDPLKYNITVQTVMDEGIHIQNLPKHIEYKTIIKQKNKFLRSMLIRLFFYILSPKLIYQKFISSNYDIEVAFLEGIPTKYVSASTNHAAEKFAWVHTDFSKQFSINKVYKSTVKHLDSYRQFNKIIFVSKSSKEGFEKVIGRFSNSLVLYNVVDSDEILRKGSSRALKAKSKSKFKIVTVGRLVEQKGFDRLLEIHKRLSEEGFLYELYIIGDGIEKDKLNKYIEENKLSDSVKLVGFQKNPYKLMASCDLFICSSRVEGYSTAVTEALILKLPVITTDCAGMKELLGNSEYGLITENNTNALYCGLKKMLSEPLFYKFYQEKALERSNYFKIKEQIKLFEDLFDMSV